eukprot:gene29542-5890_t
MLRHATTALTRPAPVSYSPAALVPRPVKAWAPLRSSVPQCTPQMGHGVASEEIRQPLHVARAAATGAAENFEKPSETSSGNKVFANLRALMFVLWTFALSLPLFVTMSIFYPFTMLTDKFK